MKRYYLLSFFILAFVIFDNQTGTAQISRFEKGTETCDGLPRNQRIRITVSSFDIRKSRARGRVGSELASMLTNALNETQCFNVLTSISDTDAMFEEIGFGQDGATQSGSSPEVGQMKGAQLIVTGEVTEFDEDNIQILGIGNTKAHIGFILMIKDPQTREILWSKSVERTVTKPAIKVLNTEIMKFGNKAMEDAVERSIFEATDLLVKNKSVFKEYEDQVKTRPTGLTNSNGSVINCPLTQSDNSPKVMVIIPETHISRRIPDPAGETEIIRKLIDAGFQVLDPGVYQRIRQSDRLNMALKDVSAASKIGVEFGADIVIVGEAFSQSTGARSGMQTCRARVEARAVLTSNAQILAADGRHAGGMDRSDAAAAKVALRNAGSQMGDYFISRLCSANIEGTTSGGAKVSEVRLASASFGDLIHIEKMMKGLEGVESVKKSLNGPSGKLEITHSCSLDLIAGKLMEGFNGKQINITHFGDNKIEGAIQ